MQKWNLLHKTPRELCRRLRRERGQVLVEFAIILPVLMLIILGILYFGRYEDYANQETHLAEVGVRFAAVDNNPSPPSLQTYIQAQAQPELQAGSSDVTAAKVYIYYPTGSTNTVGSSVRACVVTTVKYPFLGTGGTTSKVAQAATMRIEQTQTAAQWTPDATATAATAGCPTS